MAELRTVLICLMLGSGTAFPAVDFDRDIRPILSDNCFACHGPDATRRMANLRLDTADGGAFTRSIIVAGKAAESHLMARISATDSKRMPPVSSGRTLTAAQIDAIRQWIDQGAKWETHWSFVAPVRPEVPVVTETSWVRNPIDNFVLARLGQLKHSPEADK